MGIDARHQNKLKTANKTSSIAERNMNSSSLQMQKPLSKTITIPIKTKLSLFQWVRKRMLFFLPNSSILKEKTTSRVVKMLDQNGLEARNYIFNSSSTKQRIVSPLLSKDVSLISIPSSKGILISSAFYNLIKNSTRDHPYHVIKLKNKGFELGNGCFMKDSLLEKSDEKIVEKYQELVTLCKKQTISPETLDHLMDLLCSDKLFFNALTTTSLTSKFGKGNKRQLRRTMSLSHDGWILGASIHISFSKPCTVNADEEGGLSCTETLCRDITIPLEALRGGFSAKNILQEMEICDNIMISNIL